MFKRIKNLLPFGFVAVLAACSATTDIQSVTKSRSKFDEALIYEGQEIKVRENTEKLEEYRVYHRGASGFVPVAALRKNAMGRAERYCAQQNKTSLTIKEHVSVPPYILGNFPRIEIIFVCTNKNVGQDVPAKHENDKYQQLVKLKKLLDEGILTQQEFDREKNKILN